MAGWLDVPIAEFAIGAEDPNSTVDSSSFLDAVKQFVPLEVTAFDDKTNNPEKGVLANIPAVNPSTGESGLVNTVRDSQGLIAYMAPDGTNCTRTMGVALKGTPYEGMINIEQFDEMSEILHMKKDPSDYKPKAGDIAVVNGGKHMIMVTENGGFINNGFSRGGIWESDKPYDEYAGKENIDYYITTSDYEKLYKGNTEKGAKELGIKIDKDKIRNQIQDAIIRSYNHEVATGKRYDWGNKE